jgi:deoxyribonuclease V
VIAIVDVHYHASARAACVYARTWTDGRSESERFVDVTEVAPYEPGALYLRELPPILAVLGTDPELEVIIIDAYVWLGADRPGLGARLHDALGGRIPIVGVAKTPFHGASVIGASERSERESVIDIHRGGSTRPLHVTAVGIDPREAADRVRAMHGPHRIPTLIRRADALARSAS